MGTPTITLKNDILAVRFAAQQWMLSWSLTRPGFVQADTVAWLHVSQADLPVGVDPAGLLRGRMAAAGHDAAVQMMTSRDLRRHHAVTRRSGDISAFCLATVGLGNAGRVGHPSLPAAKLGTINLAVQVDQCLDQAGLIESLSIVTQARTAAVMDIGWTIDNAVATGTGTDCIVVACPTQGLAQTYAGLHTEIGAALGTAVYEAVLAGAREWVAEKTGQQQMGNPG
ncbi:hypothetical protein BJF93_19270 [Xaviernesmea oryzae]|uniref:Adenosylcobinamide amidohydrolase n=1 Tax=Xaviernesmea oryzae TaxID=464029 RepID=A0A1Q9B1E0_9HYPH|nr:adenosylcobinamide amidohydrolase [Xaviernesmea oryzae]OLP61831.1 hypothetical protein BJF93_19270 [Xaviernesmea oryzae]SEL76081.1 adenosylcobinamide hydrolase [Xaviernesmea oryzae]